MPFVFLLRLGANGLCFLCFNAQWFGNNPLAGEILSQVYEIQEDIGERVSSIVLMGSGEPLDNYDNVIKFIRLVNSNDWYQE